MDVGNNGWTKEDLADLLVGKWIVEPNDAWCCRDFAVNKLGCVGGGTLFIAIDAERWHQGSGNTGVYAGWEDTHISLLGFQNKVVGVVVERHIEALDPSIPQLLVENSYDVIKILARSARKSYSGKIIAITGTVGKSSTRRMLHHLLQGVGTVESTYGNHNTRTGVPLTLARAVTQPNYMVLEVAISALWMRSGGICQLVRPHICIITEVALGQISGNVNSVRDTARMKARIAQGIEPGGTAILNHDMQDYNFIKSEVAEYGALTVSYGFHPEADCRVTDWGLTANGTRVTVVIGGQVIHYSLPTFGKAMVSNSLAALTAVHILGVEPKDVAYRFSTLKPKESVLETVSADLPTGGKVYILDDSYNAEAVSMLSAFEVFKTTGSLRRGKKIFVLGRIANLADQAEVVHRQLAQPLLECGVDLVFAYGREMQYLVDELPEQIIGGFYSDIEACAEDVANITEPDDYILLKGSRRGNEFGRIRKLLLDKVREKTDIPKPSILKASCNPKSKYGLQAFEAETGRVLFTEGNPYCEADRGVGCVLLISLIIRNLALRKIKLSDYVTIGSAPARDAKSGRALGVREGEKISVYTLLGAFICGNAPDAVLALAEHLYGSTTGALKSIRELANRLGIGDCAVKNVTGRRLSSAAQSFDLADLYKAGRHMFSHPAEYTKLLNITAIEFKGKLISSPSHLVAGGRIVGGFLFGRQHGEGIVLAMIKGKKVLLTICGARDSFHRDCLLAAAIDRMTYPADVIKRTVRHKVTLPVKNTVTITFLGDTYFGEDYTEKRLNRGVEDALTKYGYDYCFQGLAPLLSGGDYNIVNFEAALTDKTQSALQGIKPFVLGGGVKESIATLKKFGVHAVTLGNNHAMDYGTGGMESTLKAFTDAGIQSIGLGHNCSDASEPLRIQAGNREIIVFSGYWYRQQAHQVYGSYALGNHPGVACLSGELPERIKSEKRKSRDAVIIVAAHWGSDFLPVRQQQRTIAKLLFDSGADLIIGHGAHMIQEINQFDGKWVLYSIGNGVFNSNGEYGMRGAPPYSFFTQLRIQQSTINIRLYPIYSDNLKTFWQPHPVTAEQFNEVISYLSKHGTSVEKMHITSDQFGRYIEF